MFAHTQTHTHNTFRVFSSPSGNYNRRSRISRQTLRSRRNRASSASVRRRKQLLLMMLLLLLLVVADGVLVDSVCSVIRPGIYCFSSFCRAAWRWGICPWRHPASYETTTAGPFRYRACRPSMSCCAYHMQVLTICYYIPYVILKNKS